MNQKAPTQSRRVHLYEDLAAPSSAQVWQAIKPTVIAATSSNRFLFETHAVIGGRSRRDRKQSTFLAMTLASVVDAAGPAGHSAVREAIFRHTANYDNRLAEDDVRSVLEKAVPAETEAIMESIKSSKFEPWVEKGTREFRSLKIQGNPVLLVKSSAGFDLLCAGTDTPAAVRALRARFW